METRKRIGIVRVDRRFIYRYSRFQIFNAWQRIKSDEWVIKTVFRFSPIYFIFDRFCVSDERAISWDFDIEHWQSIEYIDSSVVCASLNQNIIKIFSMEFRISIILLLVVSSSSRLFLRHISKTFFWMDNLLSDIEWEHRRGRKKNVE